MKNIVLSAVAVLAMSSFAVAGGDIAPVEEPVVVPEPVVTDSGFYIGAGYGWQNVSIDDTSVPNVTTNVLDDNFGSIMIDAGYKFNSYVAVEGRYWFGLSSSNNLGWTTGWDNSDITVDSWGIYVKPMYPVTDAFDVYALLGYGSTDVTYDNPNGGSYSSDSLDSFSWGLGAAYSFTDNVSMFIDYTSILSGEPHKVGNDYNDRYTNIELDVDTVNFGVNYQF